MNKSYTEAIHEYLAQPENYRAAKQIADQLGGLDERLVHDFWTEVRSELQHRLAGATWQVALSYPDWLSLHRPGWESMGVNCDQLRGTPDFGLHCPAPLYDRTQVNVLLQGSGLRENEGMRKKTDAWPCFRSLSAYQFWAPTTLERLLPSQRATAVHELADILVGFVKKYETVLDRIASETKLPIEATSA